MDTEIAGIIVRMEREGGNMPLGSIVGGFLLSVLSDDDRMTKVRIGNDILPRVNGQPYKPEIGHLIAGIAHENGEFPSFDAGVKFKIDGRMDLVRGRIARVERVSGILLMGFEGGAEITLAASGEPSRLVQAWLPAAVIDKTPDGTWVLPAAGQEFHGGVSGRDGSCARLRWASYTR